MPRARRSRPDEGVHDPRKPAQPGHSDAPVLRFAPRRINLGGSSMVTPLKFVGDDRALVEALRGGHPGAVAVLYERHAPAVHRALRSALGPDADLPDLLQEVFLRALDNIAD